MHLQGGRLSAGLAPHGTDLIGSKVAAGPQTLVPLPCGQGPARSPAEDAIDAPSAVAEQSKPTLDLAALSIGQAQQTLLDQIIARHRPARARVDDGTSLQRDLPDLLRGDVAGCRQLVRGLPPADGRAGICPPETISHARRIAD